MHRGRRLPGWVVVVLLAMLAAFAALLTGSAVLPVYLFAFVFWTGLSLGSLALTMVHRLTGGAWGEAIGPPLLAAVRALAMAAVLVLPVLLSARQLYPWMRSPGGAANHWYLQPAFFVIRTVVYFIVWLWFSYALGIWRRSSKRRDRTRRASAGGLVVMVLTMTLAAFDWIMSLESGWFSAVFGLLVGTAQVTAALAFAILTAAIAGPTRHSEKAGPRQDLGSLLLALVLLWGYLAFMQLLTIWIANLPAEIRWYLPRLETSWRWVGVAVVSLHALAGLLLLVRAAKRSRLLLAVAAGSVLLGQLLYSLWLVLPSVRTGGIELDPADAIAFVAVGGLWLAALSLASGPRTGSASVEGPGAVLHG